jgi:cytochrome c oxidase subunit 2
VPRTRAATAWVALVVAVLPLAAAGCGGPSAEETARARAAFQTCAACHGAEGQGDREVGAPNLAGLPAWYVVGQLRKFQIGHRAYVPEDTVGRRMATAAQTLTSADDAVAVGRWLESLPPAPPPPTVQGDARAGRVAYQACISCHEKDGSGRKDKNAPPLPGLADWYVVAQLQQFRDGRRGTKTNDPSGTTMRPVSIPLSDADIRNLAAYLATMR